MRARSAFVAVVALLGARAVAACTDGVTPDCSVASVCAPIVGDAAPLVTGDAASDARSDANPDASDASEAPLDAADGG